MPADKSVLELTVEKCSQALQAAREELDTISRLVIVSGPTAERLRKMRRAVELVDRAEDRKERALSRYLEAYGYGAE